MLKSSLLYLILLISIGLVGLYYSFQFASSPSAMPRFFGLITFMLVCVSLIIGPLSTLFPHRFSVLIEPRRAIGIASFVFAIFHLTLVAGLSFGWDLSFIPVSPIPLLSLALLFVLAITSTDYAVKHLGPDNWKNVQRLNYAVFVFAFVHFASNILGFNPIELAMIVLGIATIVLQIAGFVKRTSKKSDASPS